MSQCKQVCFLLNTVDKVCTALSELLPGIARVIGAAEQEIYISEKIPNGHKVALCNLKSGEHIVKYGVTIAKATQAIESGCWVHLHNCASLYDERSGNLDTQTGKALDTPYI